MNQIYPLPARFREEMRELVHDVLPEILDEYFGGGVLWSPAGFAKVRRGLFVYADGFFADCAASEHGSLLALLARERNESNVAPVLLLVLNFLAGDNDQTARLLLAELDRLDHARRTFPVAPIVRRYSENGRRYAVVRCPFCKRLHSHGDDFGPRCSHCAEPVEGGTYCVDEVQK